MEPIRISDEVDIVSIYINEEYRSNWWEEAWCRNADMPVGLLPIFQHAMTFVIMRRSSAKRVMAWCESVPGFGGGPEHAPTNLMVNWEYEREC